MRRRCDHDKANSSPRSDVLQFPLHFQRSCANTTEQCMAVTVHVQTVHCDPEVKCILYLYCPVCPSVAAVAQARIEKPCRSWLARRRRSFAGSPQEPAPGVLLRDGRQLVEHRRGRVHSLGPEHRLAGLPGTARPAHMHSAPHRLSLQSCRGLANFRRAGGTGSCGQPGTTQMLWPCV